MAKIGPSILHRGSFLSTYVRRLPNAVHARITEIIDEDAHISQGILLAALTAEFELVPLSVRDLNTLSVEARSQPHLNPFHDLVTGRLASATIPYEGSKRLWNQRPGTGFTFPFRGKVGNSAVRLQAFVPDADLRSFERQVREALPTLEEAFANYRSTVVQQNEHVLQHLSMAVKTY
jgi:hypothetical protein